MELGPKEMARLNDQAGFNDTLGMVFDTATPGRLTGHLEIGPQHHQPFGLVHGGVWCSIVETFGSLGGAITAVPMGKTVVGVTNTTDFLRPHREGRIDVVATALHLGRQQHLWQVEMSREDGKLVARGQVRLQVIDPPPGADPASMGL